MFLRNFERCRGPLPSSFFSFLRFLAFHLLGDFSSRFQLDWIEESEE